MLRISNTIFGFLFLVCTGAEADTADVEIWREYSSKNFILTTNVEPEQARDTIVKLEKYRFTLGQILGLDLESDTAPPLKIYAFRDTEAFHLAMREKGILGYYSDNLGSPLAALSLEPREDIWEHDGLETVFHEYNHFILRRYSRMDYPQWYSEGFAEYTSTIEFDGDVAVVGKPAVPRFMTLRRSRIWRELSDLMQVKSELGGRWQRPFWSIQVYAQGWLLTHFLHHKEKYKGALQQYLAALNTNGVSEDEAFRRVFGDRRDELFDELKAYWEGQELPYFAFNLSGTFPEVTLRIRELSSAEAEIVPLEVRILAKTIELGRHQKWIRSEFFKALRAGVRPADMHYYLALQALENKRWKRAIEHADAAIEIDGKSAKSMDVKARALWMQAERDGNFTHMLPKIREMFGRAVKADNRYTPSLMGYAELALADGQPVTSGALQVAHAARVLAPRNQKTIQLEVDLLEKAGEYQSAREILQHAIEWTVAKNDYKDYQKQYDRILEKETAAASAR